MSRELHVPRQVNLGCWHREIPGWIHVDLCDMPHIDHKSDIDQLDMFGDDSIDLLYSSHSFEYFDRAEAPKVLAEWRRVLRPGGTLRMAVPDFDALLEVYRRVGDIDRVLGPLYGRMAIETPQGHQVLYHKTAYNFPSLKAVLEAANFADVRRYDWRQTIHKDYDDHSQAHFPHMDKEDGLLISLNVEATKPESRRG
jgi:ubiquinone/menaquinone biosynthesis C-methylase UbiE